jgi:hypothetical protein
MNRVPKCRAWVETGEYWSDEEQKIKKTYKMISVGVISILEGFVYDKPRNHIHNSMDWDVYWNPIVMWSTGKKDIDDEDIFESDIVEWEAPDGNMVRREVMFSDYDNVGWDFGFRKKLGSDKYLVSLTPITMKKLGNKYEHPELLERHAK